MGVTGVTGVAGVMGVIGVTEVQGCIGCWHLLNFAQLNFVLLFFSFPFLFSVLLPSSAIPLLSSPLLSSSFPFFLHPSLFLIPLFSPFPPPPPPLLLTSQSHCIATSHCRWWWKDGQNWTRYMYMYACASILSLVSFPDLRYGTCTPVLLRAWKRDYTNSSLIPRPPFNTPRGKGGSSKYSTTFCISCGNFEWHNLIGWFGNYLWASLPLYRSRLNLQTYIRVLNTPSNLLKPSKWLQKG